MKAKQQPLMVTYLVQKVKPVIESMRKSNGCKYRGDLLSVISGCLKSNKIFEKVYKSGKFTDQWKLVEKFVPQFEKKTTAKILDNYQKRKRLYELSKPR